MLASIVIFNPCFGHFLQYFPSKPCLKQWTCAFGVQPGVLETFLTDIRNGIFVWGTYIRRAGSICCGDLPFFIISIVMKPLLDSMKTTRDSVSSNAAMSCAIQKVTCCFYSSIGSSCNNVDFTFLQYLLLV